MPHQTTYAPPPVSSSLNPASDRISPARVFCMVGLPARGKSYIARKTVRYLNWLGHRARVFNVGQYRRRNLGERKAHTFFDPDNHAAVRDRRAMAHLAMDEMFRWLRGGGEVGVYDATNTTRARRAIIAERCAANGVELVFIETIGDAPEIIEANIRATKLHSPDYAGMDPEEAVRDFRQRIAHYQRAYEPLASERLSWVKVVEDKQLVLNRVDGEVPSKVVRLLMALRHRKVRHFWLTRHGESRYNVEGRIGGDAGLSPSGEVFASRLADHFAATTRPPPAAVWTSTLERTRQTAASLRGLPRPRHRRDLDEIQAGACDGMTYAEVAEKMPEEFAARKADKARYRYPRGESYLDVIARVEPVVLEMERGDDPLLVVGHQATLRTLYGYFRGERAERCPSLTLPLHWIVEMVPTPQGHDERRVYLGPEPHRGGDEVGTPDPDA
ncbi:MAG: 6-phosphofructo-2-kinase/fructose-2,6-bisphosphatase [Myxococcota bacterium]